MYTVYFAENRVKLL